MKNILLSTSNYAEIYRVVNNIFEEGGIENIKVIIYPNKQYNGEAKRDGIYITSALVEDYEKYPHVLKFFVAHEFIHFKNKEYGMEQAFAIVCAHTKKFFGSRKSYNLNIAITLLREMRANIEGATLSKLTNTEIVSSQSITQHKNNDPIIPESYKNGYPDRTMISSYCSRYKKFNEVIAKEILVDLTQKMKIENENLFIKEVILEFFSSSEE